MSIFTKRKTKANLTDQSRKNTISHNPHGEVVVYDMYKLSMILHFLENRKTQYEDTREKICSEKNQ